MFSALAFAAICASSFGLTTAQNIDPESVSSSTREKWCTIQTSQCPLICTQYPGESPATEANDCDPDTLNYNCICAVNGLAPNISEYSQTVPYFICTERNNKCVDACNGNSACQSSCREDNACGAQSPTEVNQTDEASSTKSTFGGAAASTAADGAVYTGFGDSASTAAASEEDGDTETNVAAVLLNIGHVYGLGMMLVGFFAGFSFIL